MSAPRAGTALRFLGLTAPPRPGPRTGRAERPTPGPPRPRQRPAPSGSRPLRPTPAPPRPTARVIGPGRRALVLAGIAEPPITLVGHPRMRARAMAVLDARRRRERIATGSIGILLAIVLLGWGAVRSPLLGIERVAVLGVEEGHGGEVLEAARVPDGANVLDVDLDRVTGDVRALPWVDTVTVRRRLPSTIEIRVVAREPVLAGMHAGEIHLLDGDGITIGRGAGPEVLPTISLMTEPTLGEAPADPAAVRVAAVAAQMPIGMRSWVVSYDSPDPSNVDARLRVPDAAGALDLIVHLGGPTAIEQKAATVASLVRQTVASGIRPAEVDVRIPEHPVVLG